MNQQTYQPPPRNRRVLIRLPRAMHDRITWIVKNQDGGSLTAWLSEALWARCQMIDRDDAQRVLVPGTFHRRGGKRERVPRTDDKVPVEIRVSNALHKTVMRCAIVVNESMGLFALRASEMRMRLASLDNADLVRYKQGAEKHYEGES